MTDKEIEVMLMTWLDQDFAGQTIADGLVSVLTSLPRPGTAARMILATWDGETEIAALYITLFGRSIVDEDDDPRAMICTMISGALHKHFPDHDPYRMTDERAITASRVLGSLPAEAILGCRRLALGFDPLWPDAILPAFAPQD